MDTTQTGSDRFCVVMNDEEQYAFWPADRVLPEGWSATGAVGDLEACTRYVSEVWTDLRPKSVRDNRTPQDDNQLN